MNKNNYNCHSTFLFLTDFNVKAYIISEVYCFQVLSSYLVQYVPIKYLPYKASGPVTDHHLFSVLHRFNHLSVLITFQFSLNGPAVW